VTLPPRPSQPGYPDATPPQPGIGAPTPPPPKRNTPLIVGVIAGVVALCLVGVCVVGVGAVAYFKTQGSPRHSSSAEPLETAYAYPSADDTYSPPEEIATTEAAPPPPPAKVGQCLVVDEQGDYLGLGNCNGTRGTYRVVSADYAQGDCADTGSPYITVDGYRLCLELYLVRFYCYKFPKGNGWVVGATACKAKGTVHVMDIVPGASNGDRCTRDYKWNHWYRFTHPTVVYCVMQY
jgi:hypothetical protein